MARQVAGDHHKTLIQRPVHHMPVQAHMVVEAVVHEHCRHRRRRPPHLRYHLEAIHFKTAQTAHDGYFARRQVQPIETLVDPRLGAERLRIHQWPQALAQMIGVKTHRHKGFQTDGEDEYRAAIFICQGKHGKLRDLRG